MRLVSAKVAADASGATKTAPAEARTLISIRGLRKTFGSFVAIEGFSLDVREGEVVSLLGPSGCGKTTTLRCLAGLETPTSGEIEVQGKLVYSSDRRINLPPEQRNLSMVFQQYALWPHLSVFENVAFGLRVRRVPAETLFAKAKGALERVRLWEKQDRRISELSGGQQQRVALARALAIDPKIVLFDEPLSNLDAKLRAELRLELLQLQRDLRFSAIFVTHDQDEAISLSSRIVIMNQGRVEQVGSPEKIWREPATSFVARFTGSSNRFLAKVVTQDVVGALTTVRTEAGLEIRLPIQLDLKPEDPVELFVRMSDVHIGAGKSTLMPNCWPGSVRLVSFQGDSSLVEVEIGSERMFLRQNSEQCPVEGENVIVQIPLEAIRLYRAG